MATEKQNLVLISVGLDVSAKAESALARCNASDWVKVQDGVYIAKPDECYPALLEMPVKVMITELGEGTVTLSRDHPAEAFLARHRAVKRTTFAPQPKPVA